MKISKHFEATTESTPLNEITEALYMYDTQRSLEKVTENDPMKVIKIKFSIDIEY